jgi:2-keto-3-deoxy-L-rhamnonate aldolase RhmA
MEDSAPPLNRLRALWAENRCALGAIATIPSVQTVQILAASGLDFIIIDMEHGPIGPTEAHAMIAATQGTSLVPLARVAATTPWHAKVPLDLGVMGVCFPLISTRADAEAAVRAVRYPPIGELATSMGHRGRADHSEVQAVAMRLEQAIRGSPVVLGGVAPMSDQANAMITRGYRALVVGFDWSLLQRGVAAAVNGVSR